MPLKSMHNGGVPGSLLLGVALALLSVRSVDGQILRGLAPVDVPYSEAIAASADGSVVVGFTDGTTNRPFRWTARRGMVDPGSLPGGMSAAILAVNADGLVAVGGGTDANGRWTALRWIFDAASGDASINSLGAPDGWVSSEASGISADGSVIVGTVWTSDWSASAAFRWTAQAGFVTLGPPAAGNSSMGAGVSGNGRVACGWAYDANSASACFWRDSGVASQLPWPSEVGGTFGQAASEDGSVIVGYEDAPTRLRAFRWVAGGSVQDLGVLPGATGAAAISVSADGGVVVGVSDNASFLWTARSGMVELGSYLAAKGVDLAGWQVRRVSSVSGDGRVLVGKGVRNGRYEAWMVQLPPECRADFNGRNGLEVQDIFDFLHAWFAGDPSADFSGTGGVDAADILSFLGAWFAGC